MVSFFIPFFQLVVLFLGGQWLLNEKMGRREFWVQLLIINLIGQGLYPTIKFFSIFFVVLYLLIYRLFKTKKFFSPCVSVFFFFFFWFF